eukprot:5753975-Amphidinium_carterae.1
MRGWWRTGMGREPPAVAFDVAPLMMPHCGIVMQAIQPPQEDLSLRPSYAAKELVWPIDFSTAARVPKSGPPHTEVVPLRKRRPLYVTI